MRKVTPEDNLLPVRARQLYRRAYAGLERFNIVRVFPPGMEENWAGNREENPGLGGVFLPQGTFSDRPLPLSPDALFFPKASVFIIKRRFPIRF
jgi:hypothetical protein